MKNKQYRSLADLTTRKETEEKIIEGYFVVYNQETELWPGYFEKIDSKAFEKYLGNDIRALFDHDSSKVLARTKSNTLILKSDEYGLHGIIKINPNDLEALNLYERVKRGDIDQCSFGFWIEASDTETRSDGSILETIKEANILEVSVVTFPAYEATSVKARKKQFEENEKENQIKNWKQKQREALRNA